VVQNLTLAYIVPANFRYGPRMHYRDQGVIICLDHKTADCILGYN